MSVGDGRFGPVAVSEGLFDAGNVQDKRGREKLSDNFTKVPPLSVNCIYNIGPGYPQNRTFVREKIFLKKSKKN